MSWGPGKLSLLSPLSTDLVIVVVVVVSTPAWLLNNFDAVSV